ncbi:MULTISPECIES: hypothetical protein [Halorussus]|uniref:hypothetical protein n=1 Tax=Halorussus TaxID=1070314 RepID=UPI000E2119A8|nr:MULTISPECIES: hypothetical protein [Halorussus]NHN60173.1 hypothetical protein [Halorussus sp. JP-T4]
MVDAVPLAVAVPSFAAVGAAVLVGVLALLRWLSLSGELSPSALRGAYRDGKRTVEEKGE